MGLSGKAACRCGSCPFLSILIEKTINLWVNRREKCHFMDTGLFNINGRFEDILDLVSKLPYVVWADWEVGTR